MVRELIDVTAASSATDQAFARMIRPRGCEVLNGRDMCAMVVSESFGIQNPRQDQAGSGRIRQEGQPMSWKIRTLRAIGSVVAATIVAIGTNDPALAVLFAGAVYWWSRGVWTGDEGEGR